MDNICCGHAQVPVYTSSKTKALVISCSELDELPIWTVRRFLGPFATMRVPGATPDVWQSREGEQLAELLTKTPNIKHLLMCTHSLCRYSHGRTPLHNPWLGNMVRRLKEWAALIGRPDLEIHFWIYEPEMEWISALDHETDIFVPLNSCTQLIRQLEA